MSVANTRASVAYQEALAATKTLWEDSATGLIEKSDGANNTNSARQGNTIVFLLIRIDAKLAELSEKVNQLEVRLKNIEKAKQPTQDFKTNLEEITQKISNLKISDKPKEKGGNLKVLRNPYDILKSIKK